MMSIKYVKLKGSDVMDDICVVDYGGGNVASLCNALDFLGAGYSVTDDAGYILNAKRIMFPGVGSFGSVMGSLKKRGLDSAIVGAIDNGAGFFGICVGMQVLFSSSDESPGVAGLGVFEGRVVKFCSGKVPQIGWNTVKTVREGVFLDGYVYFVNSYYCVPKDAGIVAGVSEYGRCEFCSAVKFNDVCGAQFHPEKSGRLGLEIIRRWVDDC